MAESSLGNARSGRKAPHQQTNMAASFVSLSKLAAFTSKFGLLPATNRCVSLVFKHSQFVRRFSSVEEENKSPKYVTSQDLQLSDSCVKVNR